MKPLLIGFSVSLVVLLCLVTGFIVWQKQNMAVPLQQPAATLAPADTTRLNANLPKSHWSLLIYNLSVQNAAFNNVAGTQPLVTGTIKNTSNYPAHDIVVQVQERDAGTNQVEATQQVTVDAVDANSEKQFQLPFSFAKVPLTTYASTQILQAQY